MVWQHIVEMKTNLFVNTEFETVCL